MTSAGLIELGEAELAYSTTDGKVGVLPVRQAVIRAPDGGRCITTTVEGIQSVDTGDRRQISALQWLNVSRCVAFLARLFIEHLSREP